MLARFLILLLLFSVCAAPFAIFRLEDAIFLVALVLLAGGLLQWHGPSCLKKLAIFVVLGVIMVGLWLPSIEMSREFQRRARCATNLKQIATALMGYRTAHGKYPPVCMPNANGKPMHSWRVLILPYLGHKDLYDQYDFGQPWNGSENARLAEHRPAVFNCPNDWENKTETNYVAVTGPNTAWHENIGLDADNAMHPENLLILAEVADSGISWIEPRDFTADDLVRKSDGKSSPGFCSLHRGYEHPLPPAGNIACANGSARFLKEDVSTIVLPKMLSVDTAGNVNWVELGLELSYWQGFCKLAAPLSWIFLAALLLYFAWRSGRTDSCGRMKKSEQISGDHEDHRR